MLLLLLIEHLNPKERRNVNRKLYTKLIKFQVMF